MGSIYRLKQVAKLLILGALKSVSNKLLGIALGAHIIGGLGGGFGCWHVALAVEEASGINDEAGRVNCAEDHAVFFDLQQLGGVDVLPLIFPVTLMMRVWISPSTSP